MNWKDTLLSLPSVCDFLLSEKWEDNIDPASFEPGRALFEKGGTIQVSHFIGTVKGFSAHAFVDDIRSRSFQVSLVGGYERREWFLWGECSCRDRDSCKHVLAFIYELQKAIINSRLAEDPAAVNAQWLEALKAELAPPPSVKNPPKPKRITAALAYLIEPRFDGLLEVGFGKIVYRADGSARIENPDLTPNISRSVPSYFQDDDEELTIAFQQRLPKAPNPEYHWYDLRLLKGRVGEEILPRLLATKRLFLSEEFGFANGGDCPTPLSEGPPIHLSPQWEPDENGGCRPVIGLQPRMLLIEVERGYYLDLEKHHIGPIELDPNQSLALLRLWLEGPVVNAEAASELTLTMEGKGLSEGIPRPIQLEEKTLSSLGGHPVLTLMKCSALSHLREKTFGGHIQTKAPLVTVGVLSFKYGDYEIPYNAKSEKFFRLVHEDCLLRIQREQKMEKKAEKALKDFHLFKLSEEYFENQIHYQHHNSFSPDAHPHDWDLFWASCMNSSFTELENKGWEIRIDDSVDFTLTRADDFFTDFAEDSDRGIDWFQFDTGLITNEGQRISLMDLIANVLNSSNDIPDEGTFAPDEKVIVSDDSARSFFEVPAERFFRIVRSVRDLFNRPDDGIHRLEAAKIAQELALDDSGTVADLRALGEQLAKKEPHQPVPLPKKVKADLRDYQKDGFQWLQFLARHHLHGILADDMGLGKTLQTLSHIAAEIENKHHDGKPSLVVAPTSVVPNWEAEVKKFAPSLKILVLHGSDRHESFKKIDKQHLIITSYALLQRDVKEHKSHQYHLVILDEAQYIKNPKAKVSVAACELDASHRLCLSGTPMENHLGELWSLSRFLMPGLLGNLSDFNTAFRSPIERHNDADAQRSLNRKVGSLILRRTKDQVVEELPPKTEIIHRVSLNKEQQDLYESVRVAMDKKVRDAIADKGLARSQIIVLDALLKLRQICCHPQLMKTEIAKSATESAKLDFLVELLATLIEEGRSILLFSQFTTMLGMIEKHLKKENIKFVKITGATRDRKTPVEKFQKGTIPVFLISLKAGGTGLNLTAADTVIHYDPWWNPAAENQATDRAHRIGQKNPVFVHKLITEGSIEERILELQSKKSKLVEALLSEKTSKLQLDAETLGGLLAPLES